jgi:DNA-binding transcriptional LysR family regulator
MDLRQLRTFSCVAELGSLSKASDTLRVAQPALSRQIKHCGPSCLPATAAAWC